MYYIYIYINIGGVGAYKKRDTTTIRKRLLKRNLKPLFFNLRVVICQKR